MLVLSLLGAMVWAVSEPLVTRQKPRGGAVPALDTNRRPSYLPTTVKPGPQIEVFFLM